jgi:hypothetical protein
MHWFESVLTALNSDKRVYLIIALLCIFTAVLYPASWSGNEEHYFQSAYQTVNPSAFPDGSAIFGNTRARLVPDLLMGYMIKLFNYEGAQRLVRWICILGYTFAIANFFTYLRLKVIDALLIVSLFLAAGQQLFGHEWLFLDGESKVFAYIFVFLSINACLVNRYFVAIGLLAFATYMHFLVGLFWTVFVFSTVLFYQKSIINLIKYAALFSLLTLPLFLIIVPEFLAPITAFDDLPANLSADYIYTRIRVPHHADPFQSVFFFLDQWAIGILELFVIIVFCSYIWSKNKTNWLAALTIITGGYLILFLIISFFDRNTLFFGKFYFFRPTSLLLFIFITLAIKELFSLTDQCKTQHILVATFFILSVTLPISKDKVLQIVNPTPHYVTPELISSIEQHTEASDIILADPESEYDVNVQRIYRDIPRPMLVAWKFVPTQKADIVKWYDLILEKEKIFNQGCSGKTEKYRFFIFFENSRFNNFAACSRIIYKDNNLTFVQLI